MILSYPCSSSQGLLNRGNSLRLGNRGNSPRLGMNPSNTSSIFSFIAFLSVNSEEIKSPQAQNSKVIRLFDPAPVFSRWVSTAKGKVFPSTTDLLAQANCSFCYQWYSLPDGLDCSAHREQYWLWAPTGNSLLPCSLHPPLSSLPISLNSNCSKIQWAFVKFFQNLSYHLLICTSMKTLWASYFMAQLKLYIFLDLFSYRNSENF